MNLNLYIKWKEEYLLGIPIIDEQHRGIVSAINSLYYFIEEGQGLTILKPTINFINHYVNIHFSTEEKLIKEAGYPELEKHIPLHIKLTRNSAKIAKEAIEYSDATILLKFLRDWWINHINIEDKKFAPFIKKYLGI